MLGILPKSRRQAWILDEGLELVVLVLLQCLLQFLRISEKSGLQSPHAPTLEIGLMVPRNIRGNRRVRVGSPVWLCALDHGSTPPLVLTNVLRNVLAHVLGHGVGLGHNRDAKLLMCGRPASCRPDVFESTSPRIFPLSDQERSHLLTLYPRSWTVRARD